jgi:O-antigen/teichoic acid export membrane protein
VSRFARNTAFSSLAGLCTALGGMISAILAARLLSPAGSGVVIFGLWIVATAAAVGDVGYSACLTRFIPELTGQNRSGLVPGLIHHVARPAILVAAGLPLALAGATFFAGDPMGLVATFGINGTVILLGLCAAQTLSNLYLCALRGLQRFDRVARLVFLSMLAQLTLVVTGALLAGPDGAFCGYVAGLLGPAVLAFGLVRRAPPVPPDLRNRMRRYALFTWAANLSSLLIWSRLEILFLKHSFGDAAVGMYSVGLTLASVAVQGPLLFTGGLLTFFAERSDAGSQAVIQDVYQMGTRLMAALVLPLSFGLCALTPRLIPLLYGPGFDAAAPAAIVLIAITGFCAVGAVSSNLLFARERSDFIFFCNVGGGLLAVIGGFLLIPRFGLLGAAGLRAAVQTLMLVVGWSFIIWRLNLRPPFRSLARTTCAALACGLAAHLSLAVVPGPAGLAAAIPAGAVTYLVSLRLLGALPRRDLDTLRAALDLAPRAVRGPADRVLRLLGNAAAAPVDPSLFRRTAT